jgi:uncharacterized protein with PQ loop repeat
MDELAWFAVFAMMISFWLQVWKIHKHKEVRDLSLPGYILLAIGYMILSFKAYDDQTWIFMVKQMGTLIPTLVIIAQIVYHRDSKWEK